MSVGADPPSPSRLPALSADAWAEVVRAARSALAALPDDPAHPDRARLRGAPTGRLAGGKGRDRLLSLLEADQELWTAVLRDLPATAQADLIEELAPSAPVSEGQGRAVEQLRRRADRDRQRLRVAREERDAAQRRADGAERRVVRLEEALAGTEERIAALEAALDAARTELAEQAEERERAVARERRRQQSERAQLDEELRTLRRRDEEHRAAARQRPAPSTADREGAAAPQPTAPALDEPHDPLPRTRQPLPRTRDRWWKR